MRPPTGRFCSSFAKPTRSLFHAESRSSTVNTEIIKIIMFREQKLKKINKLAILVSVTCIFPHQLDFLSGSSILARILWILKKKKYYIFSHISLNDRNGRGGSFWIRKDQRFMILMERILAHLSWKFSKLAGNPKTRSFMSFIFFFKY